MTCSVLTICCEICGTASRLMTQSRVCFAGHPASEPPLDSSGTIPRRTKIGALTITASSGGGNPIKTLLIIKHVQSQCQINRPAYPVRAVIALERSHQALTSGCVSGGKCESVSFLSSDRRQPPRDRGGSRRHAARALSTNAARYLGAGAACRRSRLRLGQLYRASPFTSKALRSPI